VAGALVECVHIVSRAELEPQAGVFRARDPERADVEQVLDSRGRTLYRAQFDAFRRDIAEQWRSLGAGYTELVAPVEGARAVRAVVMGVTASTTER
jgi:hypothetical protein